MAADWPDLPLTAWGKTRDTLHMWTQVVGKIRMAQAPPINHWWHVTLYVTGCGLTTSPMPYGGRNFQIDFDFITHQLRISCDNGANEAFALRDMSVADFYSEIMKRLKKLGLPVKISTLPCEIENPIRFDQDTIHKDYDPEFANRFWRVLLASHNVFTEFRGKFLGKVSPVHFFWGSFDLAVTRFSGRTAPLHPTAPNISDSVTHEAYSHEVSSAGFWPGGPGMEEAIYYSYAYPQPPGFDQASPGPKAGSYNKTFGEFLLPYAAVQKSPQSLMQFLQSTYEAAANNAKWDRAALERP